MKKMLKFFRILFIIQIGSYLFIGLDDIHRKICTEAPMSVDTSTIEHLGIHTKSWINLKNKVLISNTLEPKFGKIDFVEDEIIFYNNYRINPERYALSYEMNYWVPFIVIAKEKNGTLNYGEDWEMWYAWCFFKWFTIRKILRGQS